MTRSPRTAGAAVPGRLPTCTTVPPRAVARRTAPSAAGAPDASKTTSTSDGSSLSRELDEAFHHGLMRLGGHGNVSPAVFADQHQEIFDAVVSGDLALARTAMRTHLRAVFSDIERIRAHSPELFATGSSSVPVRRNVVVWE
ncbi:FCD domain-containing protein [Streptomyces sp. NPDC002611]